MVVNESARMARIIFLFMFSPVSIRTYKTGREKYSEPDSIIHPEFYLRIRNEGGLVRVASTPVGNIAIHRLFADDHNDGSTSTGVAG